MKMRAHFGILCSAAIFIMVAPAISLSAQTKDATAAAIKYLTALATFQFKAAYDLVSPDDKATKTLAQYQDENPPVLIAALRKADKNYFRYTVKDAKVAGDEVQVSVSTRDLVVPNQGDQEFPIGQIYTFVLKTQMQSAKQKIDDPDQVLAAFKKFLADNGFKELPFVTVTRIVTMQKVKNAWFVKKGWVEAALKAQQEAQDQAIANDVNSVLSNVMRGQMEISKGLDNLQELQSKTPGNTYITDSIASLVKAQKSMDMIEVTVAGVSPTGTITFQIANKGEMPVYTFHWEYSILNYQGDLLSKQLVLTSSDKLDPAAPEGCPPGYTGTLTVDTGNDGKDWKDQGWRDTEVSLKTVGFQKE